MSFEGLVIEAIIILALIIFNGFFSSAEIAIISAKRSIIEKLAKDGNLSAEIVSRMKENPDRFLATVQVGVTVVGTTASVIGGVIASEHFKPLLQSIPVIPQQVASLLALGAVVAVISYVSLVVGELVPKHLALRYAEKIALFSAKPLDFISRLTDVPVRLLTGSTSAVMRMLGVKDTAKQVFISEEEIKYFIKEGRATGIFEETEAQLLHGIFEFADKTVREVMVPKHKISGIEINTPPDEVLKFISESGFSRYPVYRDSIDRIVGVLFNKDVFSSLEKGRTLDLKSIIRTPYFVPNSIMISKLLRELQRRKFHMAIVVDEHGDIDGLVTIEDILEEIVGEIEDEYDVGAGGPVEKLRDGTMIIDASASLGDLSNLGIEIEEEAEEYNTLAGFMLAKLQRVPRGGEFVIHKDMRLTVVDVEQNRIIKVKVEPLEAGKRKKA
ncbi:MAG: HlyC/CorC family transporter [Deltaproteobacteria bacterium]|nr:HlyC/CorC family transporter [Deltaproteobacteria bacterium]MBZ0219199.1 hemolysin family protein [Deltaproteobacteria bacterium]